MTQLYNDYITATKASEKAMNAWEADVENEKLEEAYDKAYATEFELFAKVVKAIVKITEGKIDENTAKKLVITKQEALTVLFN